MKIIKKIVYGLLGAAFFTATTVFAVSITVPSAIGNGQFLTSTTTGAYVASSTQTAYFGNYVATSTRASLFPNLSTILDASLFPGVDIGAKINAAYAALPSTGGRIFVPAGSYSFTTPIVFNTQYKVVNLYCPSGGGASNNAVGGTTLTYTATTGNAITVNTNNYIVGGSGIDNCNIQGTNGTTARTTVGVSEGGSNGAFAFYVRGVNVSGFGIGVQWNSNTSFNIIDSSTIHFNGRNVDEPDTAGANCENMRISNSVIADSNNQAGGVTDLYGLAVQESGNCQMNIIQTSFDDNQIYINQFGGTANVWTITNVHFENPNLHTYNFIDTITNVPATEVNLIGGDMMNDVVAGMPSYVSMGGDIHFDGMTIDSNNNVVTPVTDLIVFDNANNNATASWVGLKNNGKGSTYVYGTVPFSPWGYGTGLSVGPTFYIGSATATANGTTTIANFNGILDVTSFAGANIGAQINAAYAACPLKGCILMVPRGKFSYSTGISMSTNGKRALLMGTPGGGTELDYTGSATSTIINSGIQNTGIDHTSACGITNITFVGNKTATTSAPQIGIEVGGTNGTDCTVLDGVNIQGFSYGLWTSAGTYNFAVRDSTIRANGQNVHISSPSNSGEGFLFDHVFIIDGANNLATSCFFIDDYGVASLHFDGGSLDDCQLKAGFQVQISMDGTHIENPGAAWGRYTFIQMANSSYTNLDLNGVVFYNGQTTLAPSQFITTGGDTTLNGVTLYNGGTTVVNLINNIGTGFTKWSNIQNTSGGVTNIMTGVPFTKDGLTGFANSFGSVGTTITNTSSAGRTDFYANEDGTNGGSLTTFGSTYGSTGYPNTTMLSGNKGLFVESDGNVQNGGTDATIFLTGGYDTTTQERMRITGTGPIGIGTTTPVASLQITNVSSNATSTAEFGKANQNKGSCLKFYRTDGTAIYAYVAASATTFTLSTTACATVTGF